MELNFNNNRPTTISYLTNWLYEIQKNVFCFIGIFYCCKCKYILICKRKVKVKWIILWIAFFFNLFKNSIKFYIFFLLIKTIWFSEIENETKKRRKIIWREKRMKLKVKRKFLVKFKWKYILNRKSDQKNWLKNFEQNFLKLFCKILKPVIW